MTKIIIAILVVVVIAIVVTSYQRDQYKEFLKTAQKVNGLIVRKEERIVEPNTRRKEYWVTFSYDVQGRTYTRQENIEYQDLWMGWREGFSMPVWYDPANPAEAYLAPVLERRSGVKKK